MLSYLTAEVNFLRAFGNRGLLLIFLCALTRSGQNFGKLSALGISVDINPGVLVAAGPSLALLLLISLKAESDNLLLAREAVLEESSKLPRTIRNSSQWVAFLFVVPCLSAAYLTWQLIAKLVPRDIGCERWTWWHQLFDVSKVAGSPGVYCIRDISDGTPWVYPPVQTYLSIACVAACACVTYRIIRTWPRSRGNSV